MLRRFANSPCCWSTTPALSLMNGLLQRLAIPPLTKGWMIDDFIFFTNHRIGTLSHSRYDRKDRKLSHWCFISYYSSLMLLAFRYITSWEMSIYEYKVWVLRGTSAGVGNDSVWWELKQTFIVIDLWGQLRYYVKYSYEGFKVLY